MRKMSIEEMSEITGAGWENLVHGFCAGVGLVDGAAFLGILSLSGVGIIVAGGLSLGCVGFEIYEGTR